MRQISRRSFLGKSLKGATAAVAGARLLPAGPAIVTGGHVDIVRLGASGLRVPRLALGTGTHGWKYRSDQTALGTRGFIELAQHAFDAGIRFFDVADIYGSHTYLRAALKQVPREKSIVLTKIWTQPNDWVRVESAPQALDRFRRETGTDYFDIVLLHSQTSPNWLEETAKMRDELASAKAKGIIRAHGVSCHSLAALQAAAQNDWVEVILARINPGGVRMDAVPEKVMPVLQQAHNRGKGILGMKIFGCGGLCAEDQREKSLRYVLGSGNVDAMTIGFESAAQIDDTVRRVLRIVRGA